MHKVSMSSKRISPEKVKKDNSDLWRYSPELQSALRKEKFSKSDPEAYLAYKHALGEVTLVSPYEDVDLQMDLKKFKKRLKDTDLEIFNLMMLGMRQEEIAEVVGLCQASISNKLKKLRELFKHFYYD